MYTQYTLFICLFICCLTTSMAAQAIYCQKLMTEKPQYKVPSGSSGFEQNEEYLKLR
jgi:hypothetical protein